MSEPKDAAARFEERAKVAGLEVAIRRMQKSTRTAEEAAQACGCGVGQIVKSLVFRGRQSGTPYLLLVSGSNRVNEKGVAKSIGEVLTRPDAAYVRQLTGYAIGGIPPLGHDTPLKTYIDRALTQYDMVWAAAGMPVAVFPVDPRRLAAAANAEIIDVA
jgi:prolyl-tRNA editing enzyme YbaK/EbsC (Cys-tRNA(Pro) deacylase)